MDAHPLFAYSTVLTAPSPAASGTSLVVQSGDGAKFASFPFNAIVCPAGAQPTLANGEVVRITGRATDTLTITRAQETSSARTIVAGDQIWVGPTPKVFTDAENSLVSDSFWNALGDLAVGTGADTSSPLTVGPDGSHLRPDPSAATGLAYTNDWLYGDGSDGAVNFDGTTTVLGLVPVAGVYTLTRDIMCTTLTLSGTGSIKTANFRIYTRKLDCQVTTSISNDGKPGAGSAGGATSGANTLQDNMVGGNGTAGGAGNAGQAAVRSLGGAGGAGGAATGGPGTGGGTAGGTVTAVIAAVGGPGCHKVVEAVAGGLIASTSNPGTNFFIGGAGGTAGNATAGTGTGGGGGAGGGLLGIYAQAINVAAAVTLTLSANGGAGGNGTAGSSAGTGGGGGGGGGAVLLVRGVLNLNGTGTLTRTATGGAGGTPTGTGKTGAAGASGTTNTLQG